MDPGYYVAQSLLITARARFCINHRNSCNYADNKEVGTWLNNILEKGGTEDWRKVLKEATGEDITRAR